MGNIFKPCGNSDLTNHLRNQLNETEKNKINYSPNYSLNKTTQGNLIKIKNYSSAQSFPYYPLKQFTVLARDENYLFCFHKQKRIFPVLLPYNIQLIQGMVEQNPHTGDIVVKIQGNIELTVMPKYGTNVFTGSASQIFATKVIMNYGFSSNADPSTGMPIPTLDRVWENYYPDLTDNYVQQIRQLIPNPFQELSIEKKVRYIDINVECRQFVLTKYE